MTALIANRKMTFKNHMVMLFPEPTPKGNHTEWAWLDHWARGIISNVIHAHLNFVFFTVTKCQDFGLRQDRNWMTEYLSSHATTSQTDYLFIYLLIYCHLF